MPESYTKGQRIAQLAGQKLTCVGTKFKFARHGHSGAELSELLHTSPEWPMIWRSYGRCTPRRSITIPG